MLPGKFKILSYLCVYASLLAVIPAHAESQEFRVDNRHSTLSQGLSDWNDWNLYWQQTEKDRDWLYIDYKDWNHFGLHDNNLMLGRRFYIRNSLQYMAEISANNNNSLFPAYSLLGGLETKLNRQTILTVGLRHAHYHMLDPTNSTINEPDSETLNTRVEYYFGNSMISYSLYYTLMHDATLADQVSSQSIKYLYTYQRRSTVFISIASGADIEYEPVTTQLSISQIDSLSIGGNHWLSDDLALIYTMSNHRVDVASNGFNYQRNVVYFGLRKLTR